MTTRSENLVWINVEMTGLDPNRVRIMEIARIVTDSQLEVVAESPVSAIQQPDDVLNAMDDWNRTTHGASGPLERVRSSAVKREQAEELALEFLQAHAEPGASPMRGNCICQDRQFLYQAMPRLERFFHCRNLDVSRLKEIARRRARDVLAGMSKESRHLALDDVPASIRKLGY